VRQQESCVLDVELMCNEETESRERFICLVTASQVWPTLIYVCSVSLWSDA